MMFIKSTLNPLIAQGIVVKFKLRLIISLHCWEQNMLNVIGEWTPTRVNKRTGGLRSYILLTRTWQHCEAETLRT